MMVVKSESEVTAGIKQMSSFFDHLETGRNFSKRAETERQLLSSKIYGMQQNQTKPRGIEDV
jgi:hypothetical protein